MNFSYHVVCSLQPEECQPGGHDIYPDDDELTILHLANQWYDVSLVVNVPSQYPLLFTLPPLDFILPYFKLFDWFNNVPQ